MHSQHMAGRTVSFGDGVQLQQLPTVVLVGLEARGLRVVEVQQHCGQLPDAAMADTARAFAPDMQMIGPSGGLATGPQVVAMLQGLKNKRGPDFAIRVALQAERMVGDMALIVYDEHQVIDGARTARRASALFSADANAPEGVVWRHLQETWVTTPE